MGVIFLALAVCLAICVALWVWADVIDQRADEWERRVAELEREMLP